MRLGWNKSFWRIHTPEDERRSRALSAILIFMSLFTIFLTVPSILFGNRVGTTVAFKLTMLYVGMTWVALLFARTRFFRVGAAIAVVSGMATTMAFPVFVAPMPELIAANVFWLLLGGLLTSMFLSSNAFLLYAVVTCTWLGLTPSLYPELHAGRVMGFLLPMVEINVLLYANLLLRRKDLAHIESERQVLVQSEKMSALGEMSANIAHEINNPLAILHGMTSKLQKQAQADHLDREEIIKTTKQMRETTLRIAKIVRGLNDFVRNTPDDQPMAVYDLKYLVNAGVELCESKIRHSEISIRNTIPLGITVRGHETQLVQVIVNIVTNAIHAVGFQKDPWIQFNAMRENGSVKLSISDNGQGIPRAIREKIMEPYFTTKPPGEGTGIGLSLSRMLVERHGGDLYLDRDALYTTFVVRLPTVRQEMRALS